MEHVCLDLEGVLIPEIWAEVAEYTGEEQFKLTTQDLKDYSELMDMRISLVEYIWETKRLVVTKGTQLQKTPLSASKFKAMQTPNVKTTSQIRIRLELLFLTNQVECMKGTD